MIDGRKAMAMVASHQAMGLAIAKAKATGIGYAGVNTAPISARRGSMRTWLPKRT